MNQDFVEWQKREHELRKYRLKELAVGSVSLLIACLVWFSIPYGVYYWEFKTSLVFIVLYAITYFLAFVFFVISLLFFDNSLPWLIEQVLGDD